MIDRLFLEKIGLASLWDMASHLKKFYANRNEDVKKVTLSFNPLSRDAVDLLYEYVECLIHERPLPTTAINKKAFLELVERGFFVLDGDSISVEDFIFGLSTGQEYASKE